MPSHAVISSFGCSPSFCQLNDAPHYGSDPKPAGSAVPVSSYLVCVAVADRARKGRVWVVILILWIGRESSQRKYATGIAWRAKNGFSTRSASLG